MPVGLYKMSVIFFNANRSDMSVEVALYGTFNTRIYVNFLVGRGSFPPNQVKYSSLLLVLDLTGRRFWLGLTRNAVSSSSEGNNGNFVTQIPAAFLLVLPFLLFSVSCIGCCCSHNSNLLTVNNNNSSSLTPPHTQC